MAVPKATINEDNASSWAEDDIRASRQVLSMEAVTIAETVQKPPDHKFGSGVLDPHGGHYRASLLWCEAVHWSE